MTDKKDKVLRPGRTDLAWMETIRRHGFICRDINGDAFIPNGVSIPKQRFDRLIALGLVEEAAGNITSMFNTPSQTWRAKEM